MTKRTTDEWEALLGSPRATNWPWTPIDRKSHLGRMLAERHEAITEAVRLRREIERLRKFIENFPLMPPLVGTGSIEDRAYEMQEIVSHALTHILEGDTNE